MIDSLPHRHICILQLDILSNQGNFYDRFWLANFFHQAAAMDPNPVLSVALSPSRLHKIIPHPGFFEKKWNFV